MKRRPEENLERARDAAFRWRGWPALVFALLIAAGLFREETLEILYNAALLCLSCMGLGN